MSNLQNKMKIQKGPVFHMIKDVSNLDYADMCEDLTIEYANINQKYSFKLGYHGLEYIDNDEVIKFVEHGYLKNKGNMVFYGRLGNKSQTRLHGPFRTIDLLILKKVLNDYGIEIKTIPKIDDETETTDEEDKYIKDLKKGNKSINKVKKDKITLEDDIRRQQQEQKDDLQKQESNIKELKFKTFMNLELSKFDDFIEDEEFKNFKCWHNWYHNWYINNNKKYDWMEYLNMRMKYYTYDKTTEEYVFDDSDEIFEKELKNNNGGIFELPMTEIWKLDLDKYDKQKAKEQIKDYVMKKQKEEKDKSDKIMVDKRERYKTMKEKYEK